MTFRLAVHCPTPTDGTSMYRGYGVLPYLRKEGVELVRLENQDTSWRDMLEVDAIFLQRPCADIHIGLATLAKTYSKKVWIDFDDDLLTVPKDNPTHKFYSQPGVHTNVQRICGMADVITVSTEFLQKKYSAFNKNCILVPNGLNMRILNRLDGSIERNNCVVWRGSHCHFEDVRQHSEALLEAWKEFPEYGWTFFGWDPWFLTDKMKDDKRLRVVPFVNEYIPFINNLQRMRGSVNVVPLVDGEFNLAKSRIAHLENSLAGSVSIVPDWAEWQGGESFRYKSIDDFKTQLFAALKTHKDDLAQRNNKDWEWIEKNRTLEETNKIRLEVVRSLY